jgi:hypothetical protein
MIVLDQIIYRQLSAKQPLIHILFMVQALESSGQLKGDDVDDDEDEDEGDIEAQIQKELAGLKPNKDKKRPFQAIRLEMPCGAFNWRPSCVGARFTKQPTLPPC